MASIKKPTKSTKSPGTASKSTRTSARTTAATAAPTPAVQIAAIAAATATAPKPAAPKAVQTRISALYDVGFGNSLYIRGEGPGLSWDKGLLMTCVGTAKWQITLGEAARPFTFKFLVNDVTWSTGPDFVADSGSTVTVTPEF